MLGVGVGWGVGVGVGWSVGVGVGWGVGSWCGVGCTRLTPPCRPGQRQIPGEKTEL